MKLLAATYYSHFFFSSHAGRLKLSLSESAPLHLRLLVSNACGDNPSQECLIRLYECLCSLAGEDAITAPQEPPSPDMHIIVADCLRQHLDA